MYSKPVIINNTPFHPSIINQTHAYLLFCMRAMSRDSASFWSSPGCKAMTTQQRDWSAATSWIKMNYDIAGTTAAHQYEIRFGHGPWLCAISVQTAFFNVVGLLDPGLVYDQQDRVT